MNRATEVYSSNGPFISEKFIAKYQLSEKDCKSVKVGRTFEHFGQQNIEFCRIFVMNSSLKFMKCENEKF